MSRRILVLLLGVLALGAGLRLACMGAEFWLDEIWSWTLAHDAPSSLGVLAIRHDNSHPLNSLWLRLCPATAPLVVLRLPALLAGLGAIVLAAYVARRRGVAESVFAALLVGGCSWTVLASAEARGYALAVLFALAALEALWRYLDGRSRASLAAFWLLSVLGFLSHLTFVHAYIGFVVWSMRRFARERPDSLQQIRAMLLLHGPVAAFFAAYYLFAVRGMEVGGGPQTSVGDVLRGLISTGLGGPADAWGWPLVGVAAVLFVVGVSLVANSEGDVWVFFAAAVVGSPALFLLRPPSLLFERYFLIPFVFFLVLAALVLGHLWRRGSLRPLVLAMLVGFLVGNGLHIRAFVEAGRGEFGEALALIDAHDDREEVLVTGVQLERPDEFRVGVYTAFYARRLSLSRVRYLSGKDGGDANWLLIHRAADHSRPDPGEIEVSGTARFEPAWSFPSRGQAGWGWYVYRRTSAPPR